MNPILQTQDLSIGYKFKSLVENISLSLEPGKVTALIGRNGAGKSTLIKTITNHIPPISGNVRIDNIDLRNYSRKQLAKKMAVVTTEQNSGGGLRLSEMVTLGRMPYTGSLGTVGALDKKIVDHSMRLVGIEQKKNSFIAELSDGERQKGMIARALAQETEILIMDEPFAFLDVAARLEMLDLIKRIAKEQNKAILFSTHEVTETLKHTDKVWLFVPGKILEGEPKELALKGEIDRIFPSDRIRFNRDTYEFTIQSEKS